MNVPAIRRRLLSPSAIALGLLALVAAGESYVLASVAGRGAGSLWATIVGPIAIMAAVAIVAWRTVVIPLERRHAQSREQLRSLFEDNPEAVVSYDLDGRVLTANAAALELSGANGTAFAGSTFASSVAPELRSEAFRAFARAASGDPTKLETTIVRCDGTQTEVSASLLPSIVDGRIDGVYSIARDIAHERSSERGLIEQAHRIRELYLVAATAGQSGDEQITRALELGCERLGLEWGFVANVEDGSARLRASVGEGPYATGDVIRIERSIVRRALVSMDLVVIEDPASDPVAADPAARSGKLSTFVTFPIHVDGRPVAAVGFASLRPRRQPLTAADGDFVRLVGALIGAAIERVAAKRRLDEIAFSDSLTGLPNRASLDASIEDLIARARRTGERFCVHFIDLDGFKLVNDERGHAAGDELLRVVASRIRATIGAADIAARLGGDEFIVLQPATAVAGDAETLAARTIAAISEPVIIDGLRVSIGASIGIAAYPADGSDVKTLFGKADRALYRAKSAGRGRYVATAKAS